MKKLIIATFAVCALIFMVSMASCHVKPKEDSKPAAAEATTEQAIVSASPSPSPSPSAAAASDAEAEISGSPTDAAQLDGLDNTKHGWGMGKQVDKDNRPISCDRFQNQYGKYDAIFIKENTPNIYLTFDEGYENGYTSKILDVLKDKRVPAVFFVTYDYAKRNPELVQRMIDEGHVVGNHSMTHPSMPTISLTKAASEITGLDQYVKENFNYTMTLFRPPMGEFSERTLALTQSLGYKSVFWSFAYVDWDPSNQMGYDKAYAKVVSCLHNGAVYLLHAVSKDNADILGALIDEAVKEGYTFTKLS